MKRLFLGLHVSFLLGVVLFTGCAGLSLPGYIQSENSYKKVYYGDFPVIVDQVKASLQHEGWQIAKEVDPVLYERNPLATEGNKNHTLIFTHVRKFQRIIYSQITQLNVYVNRIDEGVEIDVRFRSVKNFYLFRMSSYRNEKLVKRLLDHIELGLLTKK